jgi:hypothetical protein
MKQALVISLILTATILCSGCATKYTLTMKAHREPFDTSALSPQLSKKSYSRIMVMPPSGTKRGEFDSMIALCEQVFIKKGITPINGAITGRVVLQVPSQSGKEKNESAKNLSDVERAFIMAKETGCDAILQIGQFETSAATPTRFFVAGRKAKPALFREVTEEDYQGRSGPKRAFTSRWITFIGRLSDVESGEVLGAFNIVSAPNWNLPGDYVLELKNGHEVLAHNYAYDSSHFNGAQWISTDGVWVPKAKARTVKSILDKGADNIRP